MIMPVMSGYFCCGLYSR